MKGNQSLCMLTDLRGCLEAGQDLVCKFYGESLMTVKMHFSIFFHAALARLSYVVKE